MHVYVDGRYANALSATGSRPDLLSVYPAAGSRHGYVGYLRLAAGAHRVCTYAINVGHGSTNPLLGCRSVTV